MVLDNSFRLSDESVSSSVIFDGYVLIVLIDVSSSWSAVSASASRLVSVKNDCGLRGVSRVTISEVGRRQ
jgi:hypothetical protein